MEIIKLFNRERRMWRQIEYDTDQLVEKQATAAAVRAFTYEHDKVTGSKTEGSQMEALVIKCVELEERIRKERDAWNHLRFHLFSLIQRLHPREQQVIKAYYMDHLNRQQVKEKLGISRSTFIRHQTNGLQKLERMMHK